MRVPRYLNKPSLLFGIHWASLLIAFFMFIFFMIAAFIVYVFFGGLPGGFVLVTGTGISLFVLFLLDSKVRSYGGKVYVKILLFRFRLLRKKYGVPEGTGL